MSIDIEREIENIPNEKTKASFATVFQLYSIKNYRACIVMLWSCIICDLLQKLEQCVVLHNDTIAEKVLDDVNTMRTGKDFRVDWENQFIENIKTRTKFFSDIAFEQIKEIHTHRHWCAHPSFVDNYELYSPSKDLCRDHMGQALSLVLLRPPFMTKQLTEIVLRSLPVLRKNNYDYTSVKRYLEGKYLKDIPIPLNERLFRDMWHIVFSVENDVEASENRTIGMWVIKHLLETSPDLLNLFDTEREYYSKISTDNSILEVFFTLTSFFPQIWDKISEPSKTLLRSEINKNHVLDFLAVCIDGNFKSHFERLQSQPLYDDNGNFGGKMRYSNLSDVQIRTMFELIDEAESLSAFCKFLVMIHIKSSCYDDADSTYDQMIHPYLSYFDKSNFEYLLSGIKDNSQCCDRRASSSALREIKQACNAKNINIDA